MNAPSVSVPAAPRDVARTRLRFPARPRPELLAILLLAAALDLWSLSRNGIANEYYSAAVRSMGSSWHAFLFGSFDASGVMTVDKPPLFLWVQVASTKVFGFGSWSMLAPQALMGVATVALVYDITRRRFGRVAGGLAGLATAVTPTIVAVARHNNPDMLLALCCTAAVWCVVRGLEDGRTRWLVLSGVCVGLGFETKMAAALLVVPALAAAWLWVAPRGRIAAARQLAAGGLAMTAVGLAWPIMVALTPAADRPWISGTTDNSIWSLILGYNGLGRLFGQNGGPGGAGPGGGGPGGGGANGLFGGTPGPLRLLNQALGGQGGWLLGFALVAGLAMVAMTRLRRGDARTGWIVAVGGSALTIAVAFSRAQGIFHPYYVSLLAPFVAALVGAGAVSLGSWSLVARIAGPAAIGLGVLVEIGILNDNPGHLTWLPVVLVLGGIAVAATLVLVSGARGRMIAVAAGVGLLLLAPASWSAQTLDHATNGTFPAGGPANASAIGGPGGGGPRTGGFRGGPPPGAGLPGGGAPPVGTFPGAGVPPAGGFRARGGGGGGFGGRQDSASLTPALNYAKAHGGGTVAVSSQSGATGQLVTQGADLAAIGGFSGRESQVTAAWLADAVDAGRIRWVLTSAGGGGLPNDTRTGSKQIMAIVQSTCTPVSSVSGLYDCAGATAALRAAGA